MTVDKTEIKPHPNGKDWYLVSFLSWKNSIGQTRTEMLMSSDALRQMRREIAKFLPPEAKPEEIPPFLQEKKRDE